MSELSCGTRFIGRNETLDLSLYPLLGKFIILADQLIHCTQSSPHRPAPRLSVAFLLQQCVLYRVGARGMKANVAVLSAFRSGHQLDPCDVKHPAVGLVRRQQLFAQLALDRSRSNPGRPLPFLVRTDRTRRIGGLEAAAKRAVQVHPLGLASKGDQGVIRNQLHCSRPASALVTADEAVSSAGGQFLGETPWQVWSHFVARALAASSCPGHRRRGRGD